jgi:vacuolar protein sorting-associated protein 54
MATDSKHAVPWKRCAVCPSDSHPGPVCGPGASASASASGFKFKSPREFCAHLREYHCTKEGGSFVCRYGMNRVCPSLPLEGVSDKDYEDHVARDHVAREPGRPKCIKLCAISKFKIRDKDRSSVLLLSFDLYNWKFDPNLV